jgi:chromosome segregation ATPase
MKRVLCLCLCLGLVPFAAGCVEDAKANTADKPGEKAKADSPMSAKGQPLEFAELPANDPLVANAIQAREQITELEEELLERLDELRSELASAKADPARMRESVERFLELTASMREKTARANDALNVVGEKTSELVRSSRHLASSYRALAELYRKKSRDYSEKKLRERLLGFAQDYDDAAKSIPGHAKKIEAVLKKLPSLKRKVTEVNQFLKDAVAFLNTHPVTGADPRDRYSAEFESFAVTFSEWIRVLDELRSALRGNAVSKVIRDGFEKEQLAFKKIEDAKREEIARAEQLKRDEETRLARIQEDERRKATEERERIAIAEATEKAPANALPVVESESKHSPSQGNPPPVVVSTMECQPMACPVTCGRRLVTCVRPQPCRIRLFPLFRRCQ